MVTIREYKEFCARKIIVTALQKHVSQPKINCQDTFYFYSLCRRSERQFLVVQIHFLSISALWPLFFWNSYVKEPRERLGQIQVGRNFVLSKAVGGHAFIFIMGNTVYVPNIYKNKGPVWLRIPNCAVPLLSSYIRLARRLFPDSFRPCSLCLLPASTTFVEMYLHDKLLQRGTTVDPRKGKSNTVQVMVKNGAKRLHPPIIHWNSLVKFCRTMCFCKNTQLCYWIPA